jgi:hypothetical protein
MRNSDVHFVPLLGVGSHLHPRKGGCLLELVSTLPGGRWTPAGAAAHRRQNREAVDPFFREMETCRLAEGVDDVVEPQR